MVTTSNLSNYGLPHHLLPTRRPLRCLCLRVAVERLHDNTRCEAQTTQAASLGRWLQGSFSDIQMTIHDIYPPFIPRFDYIDVPLLMPRIAMQSVAKPFRLDLPVFATSLFPDPHGLLPSDTIPRKGDTWDKTYLAPLHAFAKTGAQIVLYLDHRLETLARDLPPNVVIFLMTNPLPGYDSMFWRYLGAEYSNVFFCGCDNFTHPPIVDYLRKMSFDMIRWQAAADVDEHSKVIFRTVKGGFYLHKPISNIESIMSDFLAQPPIPVSVLSLPLFGNDLGEYGYDEVFTSRFFYYRYARNLATVMLRMAQPSLFFDHCDLPFIRSCNHRSTLVYANA